MRDCIVDMFADPSRNDSHAASSKGAQGTRANKRTTHLNSLQRCADPPPRNKLLFSFLSLACVACTCAECQYLYRYILGNSIASEDRDETLVAIARLSKALAESKNLKQGYGGRAARAVQHAGRLGKNNWA